MSYLVLARKYRSKQFDELVGQKHVATTLLNAFQQNKLGQAYLFTGTRGVGKTSVARIFAKALRCEHPDSQLGGKNRGRSCDKCPSCLEINQGSSMDVLEIDGASNNGVDNVREIREQVKFLPSRGTMKVYIIDEVHMLTTAAFNALLKTLEEPPAHVTFLLATTEVQKIPSTILSRCQRFDFKRVSEPLIYEHLLKITQNEKIQAEPEALHIVASKAEGSMRDALSALDQCLAMAGKNLTAAIAVEALGLVSTSFLLSLLRHAFHQEYLAATELLKTAYYNGVEMKQVAVGLAEALRVALLVKHRATAQNLDLSPESFTEYSTLTADLSPETIQAAFRAVSLAVDEIARSPLPRATMEMTLAKLMAVGRLKSLDELLSSSGVHGSVPVLEKKNLNVPIAQPALRQPAPNSSAAPSAAASSSITTPAPTAPETCRFADFLTVVATKKSSLVALLEHAIPVTPEAAWNKEAQIVIGFRKNHNFYQMQAQSKSNLEALELALHSYLGRKAKLAIESLPDESAQQSLVEKTVNSQTQVAEEKKKKFLAHEIVRNTKEIFGAELATLDIDKK